MSSAYFDASPEVSRPGVSACRWRLVPPLQETTMAEAPAGADGDVTALAMAAADRFQSARLQALIASAGAAMREAGAGEPAGSHVALEGAVVSPDHLLCQAAQAAQALTAGGANAVLAVPM